MLPRALKTDGFNGYELNPAMNADIAAEMRPSTAGELPSSQDIANQIRDAMAKNFAKKLGVPKRDTSADDKKTATDLRNEFMTLLARVYVDETKEKGAMACHSFIKGNSISPLGLKVILIALLDRSS